jgi:L-fucose mutarotase
VPPVVSEINDILREHGASPVAVIDRHVFYSEAETAYAIVQTGERRFYGNVMLTKGVLPPEAKP